MTRNLITRQSEREVLDPTLSSRKINYIYASHILSWDCASEEKPKKERVGPHSPFMKVNFDAPTIRREHT